MSVSFMFSVMVFLQSRPNQAMAMWAQCAQYSFAILFVMVVLQIPARFERMPFAHQNQFLFFTVSEMAARTLASVFMIYHLFAF